ncbi:WD repeat-containing protein 63 [Lobulomyces angularis]|nr:WD repeat-containing protein 63 [Lobulomyces angularis]
MSKANLANGSTKSLSTLTNQKSELQIQKNGSKMNSRTSIAEGSRIVPQLSKNNTEVVVHTSSDEIKNDLPTTSNTATSEAEILREERIKAGILPLFLTTATQELFKLKLGEHIQPESPFRMIPKVDLLADIQTRLMISDFQPGKQQIMDFPEEEILVHNDKDFKYGQNFFIVTTTDALNALLEPLIAKNDLEVDTLPPKPVSKKWESLGSDKEMESESVVPTREKIVVKASRKLKDFGTISKFGDRDAHDGFMECRPYRDNNYEVLRSKLSIAVQAVPELHYGESQTTWNRPINFCVQYEPILMTEAEKESTLKCNEIQQFLASVTSKFEQVLVHNELLNIFTDEYALLGEEEMTALEQGSHTHLQEYQSFTDLKHSKDKSISCIDWHPTLKGVLAISCVNKLTLDEKIEAGFNIVSKKSLILIWSFHDPIHPQLILEAPDDVTSFQFNPHDANIIACGCVNGQIALWDISDYQDKLKNNRKVRGENETTLGEKRDEKSDSQHSISVVKWIAVSSIEGSHHGPVSDLSWMPGIEISHSGEIIEGQIETTCRQLITASLDGTVFYWDTRYKKELKALDLAWKPFLRIPLSAMDNTFDYGLTKITIRGNLKETGSQINLNQPNTAVVPKDTGTTKFYCATEEGDLILADWIAEKGNEEKGQSSRVEHAFSRHFGTMSDLRRSPFFPDILLSVGGWSFHIWKENHNAGPLLSSAPSVAYVISGVWSPTRPGVFFISKTDGTIEVWDLLDRSHTPSTTQQVSSAAISYMDIHHFQGSLLGKSRSVHQFIAAGDDEGTLHILEAPRNLTKPHKNEKQFARTFFDREVRRLDYVKERKEFRIAERSKFEANAMEAAAAALAVANATPTSEKVPLIPKAKKNEKKEEVAQIVVDEEGDKLEAEYLKMERDFLELEGLIPLED